MLFTKFLQRFIEWNAPSPLWKFLSPNVTGKPKKKKKKKNAFNFDSIKNSFWVHKVSGIKILFPNFYKKLLSGFWKKLTLLHLPVWKFLSPNVTENPPQKKKIHLILIHSKIPFECTKSLALGCYSQDFTKNYRVVLRKVHFTSPHMKISKSKSNNKTPPKIHLIFIQPKLPFGYI